MSEQVVFNQTLLVIGAGAHAPYGFPTSKQLTAQIKLLHSEGKRIHSLESEYARSDVDRDKIRICKIVRDAKIVRSLESSSAGHDAAIGAALDSFISRFGESQVSSIDSFLSKTITADDSAQSQQDVKIGKLLISYFIKKYEERKPIGFHGDDWIQFIINEYLTSENIEQFFSNPPNILTFNYDNLLERCIFGNLVQYHKINPDTAKQMIKGLKIQHVYGHINSLDRTASVYDVAAHLTSIDQMKVVGEERNTSDLNKVAESIWTKFQSSSHIYFLGFGFDRLNSELLFSAFVGDGKKEAQGKIIVSTNIGLSRFDIIELQRRLPVPVNFFVETDRVPEVDCLKLLRERTPLFRVRRKVAHVRAQFRTSHWSD